ncbi:MAG: hypothetical protein FLDDKLPJ_03453 [Phycisphaerae bacterium]|nr:hypothetical protein [Phycisphaerae bacterium]
MVGGGYAIIAMFAYLRPPLKERLTPAQWPGVALVLGGVMVIAVQSPSDAATTP